MNGKVIAAVFLLTCSELGNAAGWTPELTITSASTEGPSDMLVVYSDGGTFTPGCTANSWLFVADSEARRARAWSTILTALATGQKIKFWYNDTCSTWSFHWASAIMLMK